MSAVLRRAISRAVGVGQRRGFAQSARKFGAASAPLDNSKGSLGDANSLHALSLEASSCNVDVYKKWANNYDDDVASIRYSAPAACAAELIQHLQRQTKIGSLRILDAGCGTGLVGEELNLQSQAAGLSVEVDGWDISPDMLDKARLRGYNECHVVDMTQLVAADSATYDAVTCVGTFIMGHVQADPGLLELVRVTKPGGTIVATVRSDFFTTGFDVVVDKLRQEGHQVEVHDFQYLEGVVAKMVVANLAL